MSEFDVGNYFQPDVYNKFAKMNQNGLEDAVKTAVATGTLKLGEVAKIVQVTQLKKDDKPILLEHLKKVLQWERESHKGFRAGVIRFFSTHWGDIHRIKQKIKEIEASKGIVKPPSLPLGRPEHKKTSESQAPTGDGFIEYPDFISKPPPEDREE